MLALPAAESAWRLAAGGGGTLEDLVIQPCPEVQAPLQAGQVRVAVAAVGVNFRDVVAALGMYPARPHRWVPKAPGWCLRPVPK